MARKLCLLWSVRRRRWHPTPVLLPGKSHGRRSLVGCSPRGRWESDTTERLHFHFSRSWIGEGNGNPLQCSCLENPRDGGAWWAAVHGVAQSRTRLKRLSSSSSIVSNKLPNLLSKWRGEWAGGRAGASSRLATVWQLHQKVVSMYSPCPTIVTRIWSHLLCFLFLYLYASFSLQ